MHDSDKQELRRVVLRVLQKDFPALTTTQFERWARQVVDQLDRVEQHSARLVERVNALEQRVERLEAARGPAQVVDGG
jgi:hypothetical protein